MSAPFPLEENAHDKRETHLAGRGSELQSHHKASCRVHPILWRKRQRGGDVEETPRPVPTAAAHRTTRDSHIKKQSDDARHTAVFATSMGQAVETRPERTAHRIRPALIAIQKFDVMMAINSSGTLRGAAPHFSSEGWRGEGWRGSSARSLAVLDAVRREPGGNRVFAPARVCSRA